MVSDGVLRGLIASLKVSRVVVVSRKLLAVQATRVAKTSAGCRRVVSFYRVLNRNV